MAYAITIDRQAAEESIQQRKRASALDGACREAALLKRAASIAHTIEAERDGGTVKPSQTIASTPTTVSKPSTTVASKPSPAVEAKAETRRVIGTYRGSPVFADDDDEPVRSTATTTPASGGTYRGSPVSGEVGTKGGWGRKRKAASASAPSANAPDGDVTDRLRRLKALHDEGLVSDADFEAKTRELVALL